MAEYDESALRRVFTDYAAQVGGSALPDSDGVRAIARRRHAVRVATVAVATAVVLAVPTAVLAISGRTGPPPTRPTQSQSAEPSTTPSAGAATPGPSGTPSRPAAPDGRISLQKLTHSTLTLPPVPAGVQSMCPGGSFTMSGNPTRFPASANLGNTPVKAEYIKIEKVLYEDVDGDGAQETVALFHCYVQGGSHAVAVFDRDDTGAIRTLGRAVLTDGTSTWFVQDIRVDPGGAIGARVGDVFATYTDQNQQSVEWQWRSYRYDGMRFTQVGGPTAFHPVPPETDLQATGGAVRFGAPVNGVRTGSVTVSVHNAGPNRTPGVLMSIGVAGQTPLPAPIRTSVDGIYCTALTNGRNGIQCHLNPLAVGATRTFTVRFGAPVADDPVLRTTATAVADPAGRVEFESEQPGIRIVPDSNPEHPDNEATLPMSRSA